MTAVVVATWVPWTKSKAELVAAGAIAKAEPEKRACPVDEVKVKKLLEEAVPFAWPKSNCVSTPAVNPVVDVTYLLPRRSNKFWADALVKDALVAVIFAVSMLVAAVNLVVDASVATIFGVSILVPAVSRVEETSVAVIFGVSMLVPAVSRVDDTSLAVSVVTTKVAMVDEFARNSVELATPPAVIWKIGRPDEVVILR